MSQSIIHPIFDEVMKPFIDTKVNDIIVDLHTKRTLTEVCEVWPGEENELKDALEYLKEYLNAK